MKPHSVKSNYCSISYIVNCTRLQAILLVVMFCCGLKTSAEPMYPNLTRDSVNRLMLQLRSGVQDTNRVNALLVLAGFYRESNNDSFKLYLEPALRLSEQLQFNKGLALAHCIKGVAFFYSSDFLNYEIEFSKAFDFCRKPYNPFLEAFVWYKKAACFYMDISSSNAPDYFEKSKQLYLKGGDRVAAAYILKCNADFQFRSGKPIIALKNLFESLNFYHSAGYKKLHYVYDLTGAIYKSIGDYAEALKYAIQTIESANLTKDTTDIGLFYARLSHIFNELGDYENAIYNINICAQKLKQIDDIVAYRAVLGEIALLKAKMGKPAEGIRFYKAMMEQYPALNSRDYMFRDAKNLGQLYALAKNYALSEKYFLEMLKITAGNEKIGDLLTMGDFYVTVNQFSKAKLFLNRALKMVSINSSYELSKIHQLLFRVDSASGDYVTAIRHYQVYKSITDSVFNERKINQLASLQIKFETEKKDQHIKLLISDNQRQAVTLDQRLFQRNAMIAGAALLLLLLWIIYNRYHIKNKSAKQLEAQQDIINNKNHILEELLTEKEELIAAKNELITEKEWLLKEVHHRVKNNLQMVMTLLYTQSIYLKDQQAQDAIMDSQNRIHAISLIHQKLYQSENMEVINMKGYIHELVDNLKESFDKDNSIHFDLDIAAIDINISKSIPIGLILNEAITNTLKYAFDNTANKSITIRLQSDKDNCYLLTIKDNGIGFTKGFDPLQSNSLGLNLIRGLCKQLKADFEMKSENGVAIYIRFSMTDQLPESGDYPYFNNEEKLKA